MKLPEKLTVWILRTLLGQVYSSIRAVAASFCKEKKHLHLRYYLDRPAVEYDQDRIKALVGNIRLIKSAHKEIVEISQDLVYTEEDSSKLDSLDGFLYLRKELMYLDNAISQKAISLPSWLIFSVSRSLEGEIHSDIRAIAVKLGNGELVLRSYQSEPPTEDDYEQLSCMTSEILADFPIDAQKTIKDIREEIICTDEPLSELESLDSFIYMRKE